MPNILIPGHTQIDDVINPYRLQNLLPGFADSMDGIKNMRETYVGVDSGWDHQLSLPYAVWMALNICFPDQKELHDHIYPRVWRLYPEYRISGKKL